MKKYLVLALLSLTTLFTQAQIVDPIQSSVQLKTGKTAEGEIVFNLDIEQGWHVYSVNLGSSGPIEASFHVNKMDGVENVGGRVARGNEISKMDNLFGMKLRNRRPLRLQQHRRNRLKKRRKMRIRRHLSSQIPCRAW